MLSRVADSIYWMARYMERAENLARLLLANRSLMLDAGAQQMSDATFWQSILMTTGEEEGYAALFPTVSGQHVEEYLAVHPSNTNSISNCVRGARENARMIRDQITDEVWRATNDLHLFVTSSKGAQLQKENSADYYESIMQGSSLFQGAARATMMRNEAWQFLQIGTYLERADKTSRLIDACSAIAMVTAPHPDARPLRWQALLQSCSAWHGYREQQREIIPRDVLAFLFLSDRFARSVRFCMKQVDTALGQLLAPPQAQAAQDNPVRLSGQLRATLDYCTIDDIISPNLHQYIDDLQSRLNALGNAIFETHVLYADRMPLNTPAHPQLASRPEAWHASSGTEIQMRQQQQQ
jgi:uncharacterized alpha-E superfamily protein